MLFDGPYGCCLSYPFDRPHGICCVYYPLFRTHQPDVCIRPKSLGRTNHWMQPLTLSPAVGAPLRGQRKSLAMAMAHPLLFVPNATDLQLLESRLTFRSHHVMPTLGTKSNSDCSGTVDVSRLATKIGSQLHWFWRVAATESHTDVNCSTNVERIDQLDVSRTAQKIRHPSYPRQDSLLPLYVGP